MAFLIDASVFITLERRGFAPADIALVAQEEPPAIATVTAAELLFGVHRADTPDRRSRRAAYVESNFSLVEVVPFDLAAAALTRGSGPTRPPPGHRSARTTLSWPRAPSPSTFPY